MPRPCAIGCPTYPDSAPSPFPSACCTRGVAAIQQGIPRSNVQQPVGFPTADDYVNARARERILARLNLRCRGFTSHRTRRPIGLRVHRRIRLQLAHNFRNLIPCNDREPSAHDEPPLILLRSAPPPSTFQLYVFAIRIKKGPGISFTLYDFWDSYNLARFQALLYTISRSV